MAKPHILIAGAGIGGLTLGTLLARNGASVEIFEKADALIEAGAGIQLSPNAMQVLTKLGIKPALADRGYAPEFAAFYASNSGKTLLRTELGATCEARYGQPYLHIHRADLQDILLHTARDAGVTIHLSQALTGFKNHADHITVKTEAGNHQGDALIGADGIHSALRAAMFGEQEARFTAQVAWRGLVDASALPEGLIAPAANCWMGSGQHLVAYYLRDGEVINFVAVQERETWQEESWTTQGNMDELRNAFAGWDTPVTTLLDACHQSYLWGIFDRPSVREWTDSRAALMGDAAHPMLPFQAQGAAMAIEDAWVLAQSCLTMGDIPEALKTYENRRQSRTQKIANASAQNGNLYHASNPISRMVRNTGFAAATKIPSALNAKLDPVYGYNAPAKFPL